MRRQEKKTDDIAAAQEAESGVLSTSSIIPYAKNAKAHPKKQLEQIARSIAEFGFLQPIVIDAGNVIIVGHGRFLAATEILGWQHVIVMGPGQYPDDANSWRNLIPAIRADNLTPAQVKAYRLADNKLNESDWDMELVLEELKAIAEEGVDVSITGFDPDLIAEPEEKDDEVPALTGPAISKRGQIWQLGAHRLMCGDSTKIEEVEQLMNGEKADMWLTDPPLQCCIRRKNKRRTHNSER